MNQDNPDTLSLDESEWDPTQMDDVFVPSVRVRLAWTDVEAAVQRGEIVPAAAHALWAHWASPGSPTRLSAAAAAAPDTPVALAGATLEQPVFTSPAGGSTQPARPVLLMVAVALASALVGGVVSTVVLMSRAF
ncbi:MAG: hypothetical protein ACK40L_08230 [Hydrogenophaga sp.]